MLGPTGTAQNFFPLPYRILNCTGEEPDHPASELLLPTELSQGWETPKGGSFPQVLILQFLGKVELRQVKFLSHNTKISARIEISSLNSDKLPLGTDVQHLKFKRLGYVSLSSNESTNYSVRELKSVYLNVQTNYLRFVLHKPFPNKFNTSLQASLISVACLGFPSDPNSSVDSAKDAALFQATLEQKLRAVEAAKFSAASHDNFERAKFLKALGDRMSMIQANLRMMEKSKLDSVQNEDYDTARVISAEIFRARNALLLDPLGGITTAYTMGTEDMKMGGDMLKPSPGKPSGRGEKAASKENKLREVEPSRPAIPTEAAKKPRAEVSSAGTVVADPKELAKARKTSERYVLAVKKEIIDDLFSLNKSARAAALDAIEDCMQKKNVEPIAVSATETHKAALAVLGLMTTLMSDTDPQIVIRAATIVETAMLTYPYDPDADESMYFTHTDSLLAAMIEALNSANQKSQDKLIKVFVRMATGCENVGLSTIFWNATKADPVSLPVPRLNARLKLMQELVKEKGEKDRSSIGKRVIDFAVTATRNPETKTAALELLASCRAVIKDKFTDFLKGLPEDEKSKILAHTIGGGKISAIPEAEEEDSEESKAASVKHGNKKEKEEVLSCEYCGKTDPKFTKDTLDLHMYAECPVLMSCKECGYIVEIANLSHHLVTDCPNKKLYAECESCNEAVKAEELDKHVTEECMPGDKDGIRCPVCHANVHPATVHKWRAHVIGGKCARGGSS